MRDLQPNCLSMQTDHLYSRQILIACGAVELYIGIPNGVNRPGIAGAVHLPPSQENALHLPDRVPRSREMTGLHEDDAALDGHGNGMGPVIHAQFPIDILEMRLYRIFADGQRARYFLVGLSARNLLQNSDLAIA